MPYSSLAHKFNINPLYLTLAFFRSKGILFFKELQVHYSALSQYNCFLHIEWHTG